MAHLGFTSWTISVNLSALQFNHPGLAEMVGETLMRHALPPGCLTLEVTESTAMRDVEASMEILEQLTDMGVTFPSTTSEPATPVFSISSGSRPAN